MISCPLWYKIFLGSSGFLLIIVIVKQLSKNKFIDAIRKLPAERIETLTRSYSNAIKIHKILLFAIPLNLFLIPYTLYIYSSDNFSHITTMLLIIYVFVIEDYFYRRAIIKKIMILNNKT